MLPPLVAPSPPLTRAQRQRYARHLLIPAIGDTGQRRLLAAKVCVMGAGGLGSPALLYLAAAGVGSLTIVDDDAVDLTNLQRQIIHDDASVGTSKVVSAAGRVRALNPGVEVVERPLRLTRANAVEIFRGHDLVLDGTDNFPRYVVNDACAELGLPYVWASVYRTQAQVSVFWKQPPGDAEGVDLRDLFPTPPDPATVPSCGEAGVLGALTGQVGSMMATEAIKLICGIGTPLLGRVAFLDVLDGRQLEIPLRPRAESTRAEPVADSDAGAFCPLPTVGGLTPQELAAELASETPPVVIDVREPGEVELVAIPGTLRIPLGDFLADLPLFDDEADVVIHCKTGPRAERAAAALAASGHHRVRTLTGGILAWIDEIAADLPRY
jgi:sulfur-carrier protein adenylyltransferase/sulfurtransferase